MEQITQAVIDECRSHYPGGPSSGSNKVAAIKVLRTATGCHLRAAKHIIEEDFDVDTVREHGLRIQGDVDPVIVAMIDALTANAKATMALVSYLKEQGD